MCIFLKSPILSFQAKNRVTEGPWDKQLEWSESVAIVTNEPFSSTSLGCIVARVIFFSQVMGELGKEGAAEHHTCPVSYCTKGAPCIVSGFPCCGSLLYRHK